MFCPGDLASISREPTLCGARTSLFSQHFVNAVIAFLVSQYRPNFIERSTRRCPYSFSGFPGPAIDATLTAEQELRARRGPIQRAGSSVADRYGLRRRGFGGGAEETQGAGDAVEVRRAGCFHLQHNGHS